MSLETIHAAIPHRAPMLLIDEIDEQTADRIVCRKTFREDEFFFQGHYPGQPIVPGVILCEGAMQAGAVLLSKLMQEGDGVPVATRMNDVKFKRIVQPGETIEIEVTMREQVANAFFLLAKVTCEGKVAVRFEFAVTMAKMAKEG
jgi:3-hydroxyacyl-[acyl-carrier-protein] dehydratase